MEGEVDTNVTQDQSNSLVNLLPKMTKLTEDMVVARSKGSDIQVVKKLNCWGSELSDVSVVRRMPNVEVLSLSVNQISSLCDFEHCANLQELYIRKNNITDINEILFLQCLPKLKSLWLSDNPCAEFERYRLTVLRALPHLQKLDNVSVEPEEVQKAMVYGYQLPVSNLTALYQTSEKVESGSKNGTGNVSGSSSERKYSHPTNQAREQDVYRQISDGIYKESGGSDVRRPTSTQVSHSSSSAGLETERRACQALPAVDGERWISQSSEYAGVREGQLCYVRRQSLPQNGTGRVPLVQTNARRSSQVPSEAEYYTSEGRGYSRSPETLLLRAAQSSQENPTSTTRNDNYRGGGELLPSPQLTGTHVVSVGTESGTPVYARTPTSISPADVGNNNIHESGGYRRISREYTEYSQRPLSDERVYARSEGGLSQTSDVQVTPSTYEYRATVDSKQESRSLNRREANTIVRQHLDSTYQMVEQQIDSAVRASSVERHSPSKPYPIRPKTRNANLLSAVLCLLKELDYSSLEVVEMAVRCRMEELDD